MFAMQNSGEIVFKNHTILGLELLKPKNNAFE